MKNLLKIAMVSLAFAYAGCQDQLLMEDELKTHPENFNSNESVDGQQLLTTKSGETMDFYPQFTFIKNNKGKVRLKVKDNNVCSLSNVCSSAGCPISTLPKECRPSARITFKTASCSDCPTETVTFVFENIDQSTFSIPMSANSPSFFDRVVDVNFVYYGLAGAKEIVYDYTIFTFADGTTALQRPSFDIEDFNVETDFEIGGRIRIGAKVSNDPANTVATVELLLKPNAIAPTPLNPIVIANKEGACEGNKNTKYGQCWVFSGLAPFNENPAGYTYTVIATMKDAKGNAVGESVTVDQVVQKADFKGRIRRVRIVENGSGSNEYKIIGTVEADNKGEVAFLDFKFSNVSDVPLPVPSNAMATLKRINEENDLARYEYSPLTFEGGASLIGKAYTVQATMLNAEGMPLANPVTMEVTVEGEAASVHNLYIRERKDENGSITHQLAGIVLNASESFDYVEITFGQSAEGPPLAAILWRMRKKPEMVFQEWDNLINDYVAEIQSNPIFTGPEPEWNPLFENRSAAGYTYPVTASLFDINGKQIGKPQTFQIIVEGQVQLTTTLVSTQIVSYDKGATWQMIVKLKNPLVTTEYLEVEFIKPYEGPAPFENPVKLMPISKEADNVIVYSTSVKFDGKPLGFTYGANIYQFGIGTRTSAGQANNKAELL